MQSRIFAKKFYYAMPGKTRLDVTFDYDTTGELDTERLITKEPCFAHDVVQKDSKLQRKTVIINIEHCSEGMITAYMTLVQAGFLVLRVINSERLIPVISEAQLITDRIHLDEVLLQNLLQSYHLQENEYIVESIFPGMPIHLYDSMDDEFQTDYYFGERAFCHEQELRSGMLHVYIPNVPNTNYTFYSLVGNDGNIIRQPFRQLQYHHTLNIQKNLYHHMVSRGYLKAKKAEERDGLVIDIYAPVSANELKKLLDKHPNIEVLCLTNLRISGELPDLALPNLKALMITTETYLEHKISFHNIKKLLQSSNVLHTVKIQHAVSRPSEPGLYVQCGPNIKLLSLSADLLPYVRMSSNNSLLGLDIVSERNEARTHRPPDVSAINAVVQKSPKLQLLLDPLVFLH